MRSATARSWEIERPNGVTRSLQVSEYKVEPSEAVLACHLFTNDDRGSTGGDEAEPLWPEMPLVGEAAAQTRLRDRLARAASRPHADVGGPPGVKLTVASDVGRLDVSDGSLIDDSCRDLSRGDQVAGPLRSVRLVVVVEGRWQRTLEHERAAVHAQEARRRSAIPHVDREVARHHRVRCARRRRQSRARVRDDLSRLERSRRDLAENFGDDVERAHARPPAQKGHNQRPLA